MIDKIRHVFLLFVIFFLTACTDKMVSEKEIITDLVNNLRAPAYPLITVDPYFCGWSFSDELYSDPVRHWTGKEFSLLGAIRVDGETYRFLGVDNLPVNRVVPTVSDQKWEAVYTFDDPKSDEWVSVEYNDSSWERGAAAFGTQDQPQLSTLWETKDIWIRRAFELDEALTNKVVYLDYSHDDIFELYINGLKVVETDYSWNSNVILELSDEVKATLKKGNNIIAAHCHNRTGGGYVDFGLFEQDASKKESFEKTAIQKQVKVLPTQTFYTFECGPVLLEVIFTAPLLMDDLDLMSRPVNYLTYQVKSLDKKSHDVQIYLEATPQWAVNRDNQPVNFERMDKDGLSYLRTGTQEQPILQKKGDDLRIDWGYFYLAGTSDKSIVMNFGDYLSTKETFKATGKISREQPKELSEKMYQKMTVLSFTQDLGEVSSNSVNGYVMLGYDDLYSIQYFNENMKAYWSNNGKVDILQAFKSAKNDYSHVMQRCNDFNMQLMNDAQKAGGEKYAELCALVYRQTISAHKLIKDKNNNLMFLSKENFSNGSIGTVDLTYPSSPLFLIYNPSLLKGMMNPIFYFSESGKWTKPFAAHDVGTYPIANGQTYPHDMPIEESGNMLILTAAIAQMEGDAEYAKLHWDVLSTWADYLVKQGLDPVDQFCTDDFAGHFAHNTNLSIKAILGIASYGRLAEMLGHNDLASNYLKKAKEMALKWESKANDGDHYRLTFDKPNTWSQKYNLIWDRLLGFDLFDSNIATTEMAYYRTMQNDFGLPLDVRRTYTKSDWIMWTAVLTGNLDDFHSLSDMVYKYANETPTRIPLSDWHETVDGTSVGMRARSVVGGYFMKVLEQKMLSEKKE